MLRDHDNDDKELDHLLHAPQEEFDDSQGPSVFGTFYHSKGKTEQNNSEFMIRNDSDSSAAEDDAVKRPLFL